MRGILIVLVTAALAGYVAAECANACSGHGDCSTRHDFCTCWDGWMGASCDQRVCPRALAHVDSPVGDLDYDNSLNSGGFSTLNPMQQRAGAWERHPAQLFGVDSSAVSYTARNGEGHFYTECANRGVCDRATGLCDCFTGYEGAACNRTSCVNGCSGHGTCQTLTDVVPTGIHYRLWEADKTQVCKCDGGYFGIDCSQKKCAKNNDPLTAYSTKLNYNYGIAERDEVQYVDVKCPYNGQFVYPSASLIYTDAQFGDAYETAAVDFTSTTASADILAALKALPNEVLSDNWNPITGTLQKVKSVQVLKLEANSHYRIVVTFNTLLGDVPTLSGKPYFKCVGGAEVISTKQNVGVTYSGTGPNLDLNFAFTYISSAAVSAVVTDAVTGAVYATANTGSISSSTGLWTPSYNGGSGKEADKVSFYFGNGASQLTESTYVKVHVTPVVKAFNPTYAIKGQEQIIFADVTSGTETGTFRLKFNGEDSGFISWDGSAGASVLATRIQDALNALTTVAPGYVVVTGTASAAAAGWVQFNVQFYGVDTAATNVLSKTASPTPAGTLTGVTFSFALDGSKNTFYYGTVADGTAPTGTATIRITFVSTATFTTDAVAYSAVPATFTTNVGTGFTAAPAANSLGANEKSIAVVSTVSQPVITPVADTEVNIVKIVVYGGLVSTVAVTTDFTTHAVSKLGSQVHTLYFTGTPTGGTFTITGSAGSATPTFSTTVATLAANAKAGFATATGVTNGNTVAAAVKDGAGLYAAFIFTPLGEYVNSFSVSVGALTPAAATVSAGAGSAGTSGFTSAQGPYESHQQLILADVATGTTESGVFYLTFNGATTGAITWSTTAATAASNIATALNALSTVAPGSVTVSPLSSGAAAGWVQFTVSFFNVPAALTTTLSEAVSPAHSLTGVAFSFANAKHNSFVVALDNSAAAARTGNFLLTVAGVTTGDIAYSDTGATLATNIQTALNAAWAGVEKPVFTVQVGTKDAANSVANTDFDYFVVSVAGVFVTTAPADGGAPTGAALANTALFIGSTVSTFLFSTTATGGNIALTTNGFTTPYATLGGVTVADFITGVETLSQNAALDTTSQAFAYVSTGAGTPTAVCLLWSWGYDARGVSLLGNQLTPATSVSSVPVTTTTLKSQYDPAVTLGTASNSLTPTATYATYDITYYLTCVDDNGAGTGVSTCKAARLSINGETVGLVDLTKTGPAYTTLIAGVITTANGLEHALPTIARGRSAFSAALSGAITAGTKPEFQWGLPKRPLFYTNLVDSFKSTPHTDAGIAFAFFQDVATTAPSNLILMISATNTSPDQYKWKLAGDLDWQAARNVKTATELTSAGLQDICLANPLTSAPVPTVCNSGLGTAGDSSQNQAWRTYVALAQDDVAHREINRLRIAFAGATGDNDNRITCTAATSSSFYYFQFGTNGVNDAPECSDRGVCDYSSGICKCFKGYNGIDCSAQSALASGSSGGGVSAA